MALYLNVDSLEIAFSLDEEIIMIQNEEKEIKTRSQQNLKMKTDERLFIDWLTSAASLRVFP